MPRVPLTAAIITLNEEAKIADCLDSVAFADEIVVVDSGSTDRTVAIAGERGAKVIYNPWPGHVAQKNFAVAAAAHRWILSLDADERVSRKLRAEIEAALENPSFDAYEFPRPVFYLNRWMAHSGWYPARKVRLFDREKARWGGENPHDRVMVDGAVGRLDGDLYHLSFDDLTGHVATIQSFTDIAAGEREAKGERAGWVAIALRPPATFFKMYVLKLGFLDGVPGLVAAGLSAYHVFVKYVKLRERSQ